MSQIVEKVQMGGGVGAKIKKVYISNVDSLIFMIYGTNIGEIYATFGTIWPIYK